MSFAVPPAILEQQTSNDLVVREGSNVTLQCKAKGYPEPYVMWRREDGSEMLIGGESGESVDSLTPLIHSLTDVWPQSSGWAAAELLFTYSFSFP